MSRQVPAWKPNAAYDRLLAEWATDAHLQLWLSLAAFVGVVIASGRYGLAPFWLGVGALCLASLCHALYGLVMLQRQRKAGMQRAVVWVERTRLVRDRHWDEGPTVRLYVRQESFSPFVLRADSRCVLSGVTEEDVRSARPTANALAVRPSTAKQKAWVALTGRTALIVYAKYLRTALAVELLPDHHGSER